MSEAAAEYVFASKHLRIGHANQAEMGWPSMPELRPCVCNMPVPAAASVVIEKQAAHPADRNESILVDGLQSEADACKHSGQSQDTGCSSSAPGRLAGWLLYVPASSCTMLPVEIKWGSQLQHVCVYRSQALLARSQALQGG
jgi:hypothetical protein